MQSVYTESLECRDYYQNGRPSMVEGEGKMNKEFIVDTLGRMVLLHTVVDVLFDIMCQKGIVK